MAAFAVDRAVVPTPAECAALLAQLQAVVVLDDVRCDHGTLTHLMNALPGCSLLLGGPRRHLPAASSSQLVGLDLDAARALLADELGRPPEPDQATAARRLWAACHGRPLSLRQAAALVSHGRYTLEEVAAAIEGDPAVLDRMILGAAPDRSRRALAVLALAGGGLLPADLIGAIGNIADIRSALADLRARGLAEQEAELFGLPVCEVDRRIPLLRLVDTGVAGRALVDWLTGADPADHVTVHVAQAALALIGVGAERGELESVVRLVRVIEPVLLLAGRWDACVQALQHGVDAATQWGDLVSQAYFLHQLGSLALCTDQLEDARHLLQSALDLRRRQGDDRAIGLTEHNLSVLMPPMPLPAPPPPPSRPPPPPPRPGKAGARLGVILGVISLLAMVVVGLANAVRSGGSGSATAVTQDPTTTSSSVGTVSETPTPDTPPTGTKGSPTSDGGSGTFGPLQALIVPDAADFGEIDVTSGSTPGRSNLTITNPNDRAVTLRPMHTTGEHFDIAKSTCGSSLAARTGCSVNLTFAPTQLGSGTGSLVVDSVDAGSGTVTLHGVGFLTLKVSVPVRSLSGPGPRVAPPGTVIGTMTDTATDTATDTRVSCPDRCARIVRSQDEAAITLRVRVPEPGRVIYRFTGWEGTCPHPIRSACPLRLSEDTTVIAALSYELIGPTDLTTGSPTPPPTNPPIP